MIELPPSQQAEIMANARKIHKRRCCVENRTIAIEMGLADNQADADKLCQSIGLVPWSTRTVLKEMQSYLESH